MRVKQATPRLNRDLSWLAFNHRVLQEAQNPTVPVFERLSFLAIFSSNLDEFFRVRVAALRAHVRRRPQDRSAGALLHRIREAAVKYQDEFGRTLREGVLPELRRNGIRLIDEREIGGAQRTALAEHFRATIAPKLSPVVLDDAAAPPFLRDRAVYLVAELYPTSVEGDAAPRYGMVEVPGGADRFLTLPADAEGAACVMFVDDALRLHLAEIFPGHRAGAAYAVKVSRDAELYVQSDAEHIADAVRVSLGRRDTGLPSRFLHDPAAPAAMLAWLQARFALADEDLVVGGRYHNLHDLHHFPRFGRTELGAEPMPPLPHPELAAAPSVMAAAAERDRVLHFPYQSYEPVLRFVAEAAADEAVEEVWITLYRVASNSAIVQSLIAAAERGKRVTAIVEVQARFDEAANLEWASRMQAAGVRVIHGLPGLKVHAKLILVGRREGGDLRDYALLSTGNFNEKTARIYADHALMTVRPELVSEVRAVVRMLAGEAELPPLLHLLVAPEQLRPRLHRLIEREVEHARAGHPARIVLKMNSLEDPEMIDALCWASTEGVRIDVVVRGICCLAPGVPGVSEHVRARSLVDRFLEHARVFVFHDGGRDACYLASADWMTRNLSRRVEVAFPLYDERVRREVFALLELQLADNTRARVLDPGLRNQYAAPGDPPVRAQIESYRLLQGAQAPAAASAATFHPTMRAMPQDPTLAPPAAVALPVAAEEGKKKDKKDRERLEKELEKLEKEKAKSSDKGMDTMFRTSYRMHTDLSAIADSKAGIMISINGLIVSIVLAAIAPRMATTPLLAIPTSVLLITGVVSLGFSVLAARPRVRTGALPTDAQRERARPNLLFFGSFVSMTPDEYQQGVEELMQDPGQLYRDMARDIYGLGTVLEQKFKLLRASYNVFLGGLVASVLLYIAVYLIIIFRTQPPAV